MNKFDDYPIDDVLPIEIMAQYKDRNTAIIAAYQTSAYSQREIGEFYQLYPTTIGAIIEILDYGPDTYSLLLIMDLTPTPCLTPTLVYPEWCACMLNSAPLIPQQEYLFMNQQTGKPYTTITKVWDRLRKVAG